MVNENQQIENGQHTEKLNLKIKKRRICVVAGMPRSGTTFLYYMLQKHPSVFVPFRKEIDFFNYNYDKSVSWYLNYYKDAPKDKICFDISPAYFLSKPVIERINEFNPGMKIILCVRDPVEYSLSCYAHVRTFLRNVPSFEDFITLHRMEKNEKTIQVRMKREKVLDTVESYREAFGDNLLLYSFDLFKKNPLYILQSIESFTGIPNFFNDSNVENVPINTAARRNTQLLSHFLRNDKIVSSLELLPPSIVSFFRNMLELKLARNKEGANVRNYSSEEDIKLAETVFADQREAVKEFFAENEMQLGSGKPFP